MKLLHTFQHFLLQPLYPTKIGVFYGTVAYLPTHWTRTLAQTFHQEVAICKYQIRHLLNGQDIEVLAVQLLPVFRETPTGHTHMPLVRRGASGILRTSSYAR